MKKSYKFPKGNTVMGSGSQSHVAMGSGKQSNVAMGSGTQVMDMFWDPYSSHESYKILSTSVPQTLCQFSTSSH